MGKKKNTGAKRGPPQHFNGVQKDFLTEHVSTYLNALDADNNGTEAGCFYTKMAREYSDKWCNDEAEDEAEASEPLTKAKAENASKSFIKLREKLAQWYRRNYKRPEVTARAESGLNPFLDIFHDHATKRPRRYSPVQFYMKGNYGPHMKAEFDRRYAKEKADYVAATPEEHLANNMKQPAAIKTRAAVGAYFLELETEEFRDQIKSDLEDDYKKEIEEWELTQKQAKTPQEYHQLHANAAHYILPVAKSIAEMMQAAVTIMITGPVPERNGEVEVRSVHVNWPGGLSSLTWPAHDPVGYSDAEKSACTYGRANFSSEECRRRALPLENSVPLRFSAEPGRDPLQMPERMRSSSLSTPVSIPPPAKAPEAMPMPPGVTSVTTPVTIAPTVAIPPATTPISIPPPVTPEAMPMPPGINSVTTPATIAPTVAIPPATTPVCIPPPVTAPEAMSMPLGMTPATAPVTIPSAIIAPATIPTTKPRPQPRRIHLPPPPTIAFPEETRPETAGAAGDGETATSRRQETPGVPDWPEVVYGVDKEPIVSQEGGVSNDAGDVTQVRGSPEIDTGEARLSSMRVDVNDEIQAVLTLRKKLSQENWEKEIADIYNYTTGLADGNSEQKRRGLGEVWKDCVSEWANLQGGVYQKGKSCNLPVAAKIRPTEVAGWIRASRPLKKVEIEFLPVYKAAWKAWWLKVGPSQAERSDNANKWPLFRMRGRNGIVLLLLSLSWWGIAAEAIHEVEDWTVTVKDITEVLRLMQVEPKPKKITLKRKRRPSHGDKEVVSTGGGDGRPSRLIKPRLRESM